MIAAGTEISFDGRSFIVNGHNIQGRHFNGGRSFYRNVPYMGPLWWRIMDVVYPEGVRYSDTNEFVAR